MTMPKNSDEQRAILRQQLQSHRQLLAHRFNPGAAAGGKDTFPRSMTMRMLTGKSTVFMLMLAEALPLLLARYIAKSSQARS